LREILNIDDFKKWLFACCIEKKTLLYYFALSKCQLSTRTNINNSILIAQKIATYFYNPNNSLQEDYISLNNNINLIYDSPMQQQQFILTNTEYECIICFKEDIKKHNILILNCNHTFCKECIISCLKSENIQHNCFLCRCELNNITILL
jgi:hypothetical protein